MVVRRMLALPAIDASQILRVDTSNTTPEPTMLAQPSADIQWPGKRFMRTIERRPEGDALAQSNKHRGSILGKVIHDAAAVPAAVAVLQGLRQVPVVPARPDHQGCRASQICMEDRSPHDESQGQGRALTSWGCRLALGFV